MLCLAFAFAFACFAFSFFIKEKKKKDVVIMFLLLERAFRKKGHRLMAFHLEAVLQSYIELELENLKKLKIKNLFFLFYGFEQPRLSRVR